MTESSRRDVMRKALAAALVTPLLGNVAHGQSLDGNLIAPPNDPMRYSRTVERDMFDGAVFRVARSFTLAFQRHSDGYTIEGRQSSVSVDAPDSLASFAEIERARDESGIFPIALDPFGRILSGEAARSTDEEIRLAAESAQDMLESRDIPPSDRAPIEQFIAAVHGAGQRITAHLPVDLFAPAGSPRRAEQRIVLPGGGEGRVETVFRGEIDGATGLMKRASREIVTEVDGSRRTTRELWSLGSI